MGGLENLDPWLSDGLDCTSVVQFLFFPVQSFRTYSHLCMCFQAHVGAHF